MMPQPSPSSEGLRVHDLQRLVRAAKAAGASISAIADAVREVQIEAACVVARRRLGNEAPPPSWDVEREGFLRRIYRDGES